MDILSVSGQVIFTAAVSTIKDLVVAAVANRANLYGADLYGADLCGADLRGADLRGADLYGASLRGADLRGASLCGANLYGADLRGASLCGASLRDASLCGANLRGADLRSADLYGADLRDTKNSESALAMVQFIPEEGSFIGWKKCKDKVLVKLSIPAAAKRSHGTERKCRASFVKVLDVVGAEVGVSIHDGKTEYRKGKTVKADSWDENRWNVCAPGIHFFLTRREAEDYYTI